MAKWVVCASAVTFGHVSQAPIERLREAGCEVRLNPLGRPLNKGEMTEFAKDADALILGNDQLSGPVIKQLKKLKIIARYGVGFDGVDLAEAKARGILVTYAPAANREETADFTFGLILDLARHITNMAITTRGGGFEKRAGVSLYGKTIGILGVGQVGTAVARRAVGFGMDVLGYDIDQRTEPTVYGCIYTTLNDLLRRSDIISLHLPLNDSTCYLIGARELCMMKASCILVNTARGGIIRHDALNKALLNGEIAAYATDVFETEPPTHQSYFDYENVLVTPHVAGSTWESSERMGNVVADNVLAAMRGDTPPDLVTPQHLYESMMSMGVPANPILLP